MRPRIATFAVAVLAASCGVAADHQARDIATQGQTAAGGPSTAVSGQVAPPSVYVLAAVTPNAAAPLTAVERPGHSDPTSLLTSLFQGPTSLEQRGRGLRSAVPAGTLLHSVTIDNPGTLRVDVSGEFLAATGQTRVDAVAEIVYTASKFDGVKRVLLLVDGVSQDWPTGTGSSTRQPLSVFDFPDRIPSASAPDASGGPTSIAAAPTTGS